jgi:hypothetical protein
VPDQGIPGGLVFRRHDGAALRAVFQATVFNLNAGTQEHQKIDASGPLPLAPDCRLVGQQQGG